MNSVWTVVSILDIHYEDTSTDILGVFSSEEDAEGFKFFMEKEVPPYKNNCSDLLYYVEEHKVTTSAEAISLYLKEK